MFGNLYHEDTDDVTHASGGGEGNDVRKLLKPADNRSRFGFVGLENQGATCYLNALLQVCYMTPELRYGLFNIDPSMLGAEDEEEVKPAEPQSPKKQLLTAKAEKSPLPPLVQSIVDMGFSEMLARDAVRKTGGDDLEAALDFAMEHADDAVYQVHHSAAPDFKEEVKEGKEEDISRAKKKRQRKPRLIPLELQQLFTKLQCLDISAVSTHELTSKGFAWQAVDGAVQHDAHELYRLLIDGIEKSLKYTVGEKLCEELYTGVLWYQIKCLTCQNMTQHKEDFCDLILPVINCENLAASLRLLTAPEMLDGENKYACEYCRSKQPAHRRLLIEKLPPMLTMSCQRFDIDRTTWQRVKVTTKCEFPLAIDMTHFRSSNTPLSNEPDKEKERVRKLSKHMTILDDAYSIAVEEAQRVIAEKGIGVTVADIPQSVEWVRRCLCLSTSTENIYELFAVVIHQGTAHSGHYSAYIRDVQNEGCWENPDMSACVEAPTVLFGRDTHGDLCVLEESPLHMIINIFQNVAACNAISDCSGGMTAKDISEVVTANLGKTWRDVYFAKHGNISTFLQNHSLFFESVKSLRKPLKYQLRNVPFRIVPADVFAKLSIDTKPAQNTNGGCDAAESLLHEIRPPSYTNGSYSVAESKDTTTSLVDSPLASKPGPEFDSTEFAIQGSAGQWYVLENSELHKLLETFNGFSGAKRIREVDAYFKRLHGDTWRMKCDVSKYGTLYQFMKRMPHFFDIDDNSSDYNGDKICRRVTAKFDIVKCGNFAAKRRSNESNRSNAANRSHYFFNDKGNLVIEEDTPLFWVCYTITMLGSTNWYPPNKIIDGLNASHVIKGKYGNKQLTWRDIGGYKENLLEFMSRHDDIFERNDNSFKLCLSAYGYIKYPKDLFEVEYLRTTTQDMGPVTDAKYHAVSKEVVDYGWQQVRNGKKSSASSKSPTVNDFNVQPMSLSSCDASDTTLSPVADTKIDDASLRVENSVDILAQQLLNACFGQFYLFNDSEVRPVCITDISKSFEGRNSAYLLVYRKVSLPAAQPVKPPAYWMEKIAAQNAQLAQDRAAYEEAKRCVRVRIFIAPLHFSHEPPLLVPVSHPALDPLVAKGYAVELVSTAPLREHFEVVLQSLASFGIDTAQYLGRSIRHMKFSRLEKYGESFYAGPELDPQTITADIASGGETSLLLWSTLLTPEKSITILTAPPKQVVVKYRTYRKQIGHFEMLFANNSSAKEVCEASCEKAGMSFRSSTICVLNQMPARPKSQGYRGKLREYSSSVLFERGDINFSWPQALTWGAVNGHELIIDDSYATSHLADEEVYQRNRIITIHVEVDFIGNTKDVKSDLEKDGCYDEIPDGSVTIEMDYEASVHDLKQLIAKQLKFGLSLTKNIVLRLGHQRGMDILSFEMVSLLEAEVTDGCTVYVEHRAEKPKDTHIVLRYCRVTGNDLNLKHNPKKSGDRSRIHEIHADLSLTVEDLRAAMIGRVTDAAAADADMENILKNATRLRLTNEHAEVGELLEERLQDGMVVKLKDLVAQNRLRSGTLLLVEDGKPYLLGQYHMDVYIWNPQHKSTLAEDNTTMKPITGMHPNRANKWCNLNYIGSYGVSQNASLIDLQMGLFDMAISYQVEQITDWDSFLIRELKKDLLPGRDFWATTPKMQTEDTNNIGSGKAKPGPQSPLERHGFKTIQMIVLQPLPKLQRDTGAPEEGTFTIWAQRVLAIQGSYAIMNPEWPPLEVKIKGGNAPNLMRLSAPLSEEFGIDLRHLRIFKYYVSQAKWIELVPGMKGKSNANKAGKTENILSSPYVMRSGDLVCALDSREFAGEDIVIDREEDAHERLANPETAYVKPEKRVRHRAEVALKFGGNLNFSDDDDESV